MSQQTVVLVPFGKMLNDINLHETDPNPVKHRAAINAYLTISNGVGWFVAQRWSKGEGGTELLMERREGTEDCPLP